MPNDLFHVAGDSWGPGWQDLKIKKTRHMSLITSAKRDHPGHMMRHDLIAWAAVEQQDMAAISGGQVDLGGGLTRKRAREWARKRIVDNSSQKS